MGTNRHKSLIGWIDAVISSYSHHRLVGRVRTKLTWDKIFRVVSYTKSSLWIVPLIAIVLEQITVRVLHVLDTWFVWPLAGTSLPGAEATLQTIITLCLSFMVFTFGSLLVAIQVASGQLTPRIIATTLLRDNVVRCSVGLFVFTLTFAVGALNRTEQSVHQLVLVIAALLGLTCLATFLYLIDYASRLLRPVSIIGRVSEMGLAVIDSVYPQPTQGPPARTASERKLGPAERKVFHRGKGEFILGVNLEALVAASRESGCVIECVPRVGDFIGTGEPLFLLYGSTAVNNVTLRAAVAFGPERTMDQDPTFAFRILVDIAIKALSPAINDPTTAVLALDRLHRLLRRVGRRHLHDDEVHDDSARLCVILRTPNWEEFVQLSFTEIRHCGAGNVQVARRLRAVIENLIGALPEYRHQALRRELELLDRTVEHRFALPEDLALARIPDSQGLGGAGGP
jgi:uncharacterized membrane protein